MLGVYTIIEAGAHGRSAQQTLGQGLAAVALLLAFLAREARASQPLMPLRIFRSRVVTTANLVQAFMFAGMFGMFFLGALFLQRVLGNDAFHVGLAFLPVAVTIGALSLWLTPRLIMRFGARETLLPGLVLIMTGLLVFTRAGVNASYMSDILPAMLLLGIGAGLSLPSLMTLAMSEIAPSDSGLASGLINTTQQVGGALGLAVVATLSTSRTGGLLADGASTASALTSGYHLAFGIGAAFVGVGLVLAATWLRPEGMHTGGGIAHTGSGEQRQTSGHRDV
jgi:hypothetical protein